MNSEAKYCINWVILLDSLNKELTAGKYMFKVNNESSRLKCRVFKLKHKETTAKSHWLCQSSHIVQTKLFSKLFCLTDSCNMSQKLSTFSTVNVENFPGDFLRIGFCFEQKCGERYYSKTTCLTFLKNISKNIRGKLKLFRFYTKVLWTSFNELNLE